MGFLNPVIEAIENGCHATFDSKESTIPRTCKKHGTIWPCTEVATKRQYVRRLHGLKTPSPEGDT